MLNQVRTQEPNSEDDVQQQIKTQCGEEDEHNSPSGLPIIWFDAILKCFWYYVCKKERKKETRGQKI